MSDDKTELPTAERIQELREKGIISYSARSTACLVLLVLIGLYTRDFKLIDKFRSIISQTQSVESLSQIGLVLQQIFIGLFITPLLGTLVAVLLWGLVQSKFLLKMGLINIDFTRLTSRVTFSLAAIMGVFVKYVCALFAALVCMALIWTTIAVSGLRMLHARPEQAVYSFYEGTTQGMPLAIIVIGFMTLVLLFIEKLRFALANRMTRKEARTQQ